MCLLSCQFWGMLGVFSQVVCLLEVAGPRRRAWRSDVLVVRTHVDLSPGGFCYRAPPPAPVMYPAKVGGLVSPQPTCRHGSTGATPVANTASKRPPARAPESGRCRWTWILTVCICHCIHWQWFQCRRSWPQRCNSFGNPHQYRPLT